MWSPRGVSAAERCDVQCTLEVHCTFVNPPRVPLSSERVLRAAIDHADTKGVGSLSMRKLARDLGFEVMSLYNHVANKDEVLDGILELVSAEIEPPSGADWKTSLRDSVRSAHDVLLRHPWAAGLWWSRRPGPARLAYMESLLRALREAEFPPALAYHGYHAVLMHILGFTVQELELPPEGGSIRDLAEEFLGTISTEQFPYLVEHVAQHIDHSVAEDGFDYVLDLILDGLERARDASR